MIHETINDSCTPVNASNLNRTKTTNQMEKEGKDVESNGQATITIHSDKSNTLRLD